MPGSPPPLICEQGYTQGRIRAGCDFPVPIPQCACWDTGELRCTRFARSREPMNASPPLFLKGRQEFRAIFDSGEFCFPGPPLHPYLREMVHVGCNARESQYARSIKCLAPPSPPRICGGEYTCASTDATCDTCDLCLAGPLLPPNMRSFIRASYDTRRG